MINSFLYGLILSSKLFVPWSVKIRTFLLISKISIISSCYDTQLISGPCQSTTHDFECHWRTILGVWRSGLAICPALPSWHACMSSTHGLVPRWWGALVPLKPYSKTNACDLGSVNVLELPALCVAQGKTIHLSIFHTFHSMPLCWLCVIQASSYRRIIYLAILIIIQK